jgi:hypothetical protein
MNNPEQPGSVEKSKSGLTHSLRLLAKSISEHHEKFVGHTSEGSFGSIGDSGRELDLISDKIENFILHTDAFDDDFPDNYSFSEMVWGIFESAGLKDEPKTRQAYTQLKSVYEKKLAELKTESLEDILK